MNKKIFVLVMMQNVKSRYNMDTHNMHPAYMRKQKRVKRLKEG